MNERELLIEKLVTTMHLSVPERAALSTDCIRYSDVITAVARVLEDTGYFPPNARPWQEGKIVHEGAILQKLSAGRKRSNKEKVLADKIPAPQPEVVSVLTNGTVVTDVGRE